MKTKKLLLITIPMMILIIIFTILVQTEPHLYLDNPKVEIEYGTKDVDIQKEDFITSMPEKELDKVIMECKETSFKNIGTYPVNFRYRTKYFFRNEKAEGIVEVNDTKAPVFTTLPAEIVVEQNAQSLDLRSYFAIDDLSDCSLEVNVENADLTKPGTYKIKVMAVDKFNNETTDTVKLTVIDSSILQNASQLSKTLDNTIPVSQETELKIVQGILTLSNDNVITVGENGKVVAKGIASSEEVGNSYAAILKKQEEKEKKKLEEEKKKQEEKEEKQRLADFIDGIGKDGKGADELDNVKTNDTFINSSSTETACVPPMGGNVFSDYQKALAWGDDFQLDNCDTVNGFRIETKCGYYIVKFDYRK